MNNLDPDEFLELCYAATTDLNLWNKVLDDFGRAVGARGSLIVSYDPSRTANTMHSSCLQEVGEDYSKIWWQHDTRIARAKSLSLKPGTVYVDAAYFSREEKQRDPFFQDFFNRHGLDDMAAFFSTDPHGNAIATISAPRNTANGPYEQRDIVLLRQLAPHVIRAFHLAASFSAARLHSSDLAIGLDTANIGTILLDPDGNVFHVSETAERYISSCFRVRHKRQLQGLTVELQRKLDELISSATSSINRIKATSSLFRALESEKYLHIEAVLLKNSEAIPLILQPRGQSVLLLIRDAFSKTRKSIVPHLQEMGLTPAEAHVAMLVGRGFSPKKTSQILSVSENTIRTQLRVSFSKLNIKGQSELAYMIAQIDILSKA